MTTDVTSSRRRYMPVRTEPPPRRQQLLDYIMRVDREEKRFPSQREICDHMGWLNATSARDALNGLVSDGKLVRIRDGKAIAFRLPMRLPGATIHDPEIIARVMAEYRIGCQIPRIAAVVGLTRMQVRGIIKREIQKKPRRA